LWISLKTPPTHLMLEPPNNAFSTIPGMPILSPLGEEGFLGKASVPDTGRGSHIFPTAEQPANLDNSNLRSQPGDEATIGPTHTNGAGTLGNEINVATSGDTSGIDTTSPYKGNLGEAAVGPTHTDQASTLGNETNVATGGDTSGIDTRSAYKSNLSEEVTGPTNALEANTLRNKSNVTASGDTSTADGDMSSPNTNQKPIPQGEGAISPTSGSESYVVPSSPHGTGMEVEVTTDRRKQSPIPPRAETATTTPLGPAPVYWSQRTGQAK
jgi:hypothetical protein